MALVAIGGLYPALPENVSLLPRWLAISIIMTLLGLTVCLTFVRTWQNHRAERVLWFVVAGIITAFMALSLGLLVSALPQKPESATDLLWSAGALWSTNVLVFALWYWHLDAGGPHRRETRPGHPDGAFLFPQMSLEEDVTTGRPGWSPRFVDYLFLAFTSSTALSPTDTAVLSRWAKVLMLVQVLISFAVIALVAARAINLLES